MSVTVARVARACLRTLVNASWTTRIRCTSVRGLSCTGPPVSLRNSVTIPDWVPGVGGEPLGFNIPTIPALAAGGIATAPTLAQIGEGGEPEAVLPLSKLAALLDEWTKPKPTPGGGTGGGGGTVVFSPVFNFYGGTPSREEAEEAGRISFAEFKKLYRQMKAEEKRKQFSPA